MSLYEYINVTNMAKKELSYKIDCRQPKCVYEAEVTRLIRDLDQPVSIFAVPSWKTEGDHPYLAVVGDITGTELSIQLEGLTEDSLVPLGASVGGNLNNNAIYQEEHTTAPAYTPPDSTPPAKRTKKRNVKFEDQQLSSIGTKAKEAARGAAKGILNKAKEALSPQQKEEEHPGEEEVNTNITDTEKKKTKTSSFSFCTLL